MEIVTVDQTSLVNFETIKYGELFNYENIIYVKTGYVPATFGNDAWNCYRIGSGGGTNSVESYALVLPVKKLTVEY